MTTEQLIQELETNERILPKDLLQQADAETLAREAVLIFENHRDLLEQNKALQRNFLELVNYLYIVSLNKKAPKPKSSLFSDRLINGLLSLPDPA